MTHLEHLINIVVPAALERNLLSKADLTRLVRTLSQVMDPAYGIPSHLPNEPMRIVKLNCSWGKRFDGAIHPPVQGA